MWRLSLQTELSHEADMLTSYISKRVPEATGKWW